MNRFLRLAALGFVAGFFGVAVTEAQSAERLQTGRYQLTVNYDGTMFLLDTTTGQCWTKSRRGEWVDAGNPAKPKPKHKPKVEPAKSPIEVVLPRERVELTIKQRRSKAIPGSNGRVLIYVDDITRGQSLISIRDDRGAVLLDDVSARHGSVFEFTVNKRQLYVHVKELKNFVVGEDFAILEVASKRGVFGAIVTPGKSDPETPKPVKPSRDDAAPKPKA